MATIYALADGGPWSADDDGITGDGYFNKGLHRLSTVGNGPTVDGLNISLGPRRRVGGLVSSQDHHLTRGHDR